jgi:hypothetical protein
MIVGGAAIDKMPIADFLHRWRRCPALAWRRVPAARRASRSCGVGADGNDRIALAQRLPNAEFVAPDAPGPCAMAPFGCEWLSLRERRPEALLLGVPTVTPLVDVFLDAELERHRLAAHQLARGSALFGALRSPPSRRAPGASSAGLRSL